MADKIQALNAGWMGLSTWGCYEQACVGLASALGYPRQSLFVPIALV